MKKRTGNKAKARWPRCFRFESEQDFKLRILALYHGSSLSEVIRLALEDFWIKHEDKMDEVDETDRQREFRKAVKRMLEEP